MRRTVIALLLMSGTVAAVAQPAKQNPSAQAPPKGHCDVGVVSRLREEFKVREAGFPEKTVTVGSWHLDDLVVDKVRGALGKRAEVQRIPYRKEAFAWFEPQYGRHEPPLFRLLRFRGYASEFRDAIRTLAPGARCARYVLVTKAQDYDGVPMDIGIGKGPLGLVLSASMRVWVFDGETFKVLSNLMDDHESRTSYVGISGSHPKLDETFWPGPPNSAAQNAKLREATRELIAKCLDRTLPKPLP
jgi:hypothetical protein